MTRVRSQLLALGLKSPPEIEALSQNDFPKINMVVVRQFSLGPQNCHFEQIRRIEKAAPMSNAGNSE